MFFFPFRRTGKQQLPVRVRVCVCGCVWSSLRIKIPMRKYFTHFMIRMSIRVIATYRFVARESVGERTVEAVRDI